MIGGVQTLMTVARHGFSIRFDFPVFYTRDVFAPDNRSLLDALNQRDAETGRRHRMFVAVDASVAAAQPALVPAIESYVAAHADGLALAGPPLLVPGGEASKNDLQHTLDLRQVADDGAAEPDQAHCKHHRDEPQAAAEPFF